MYQTDSNASGHKVSSKKREFKGKSFKMGKEEVLKWAKVSNFMLLNDATYNEHSKYSINHQVPEN